MRSTRVRYHRYVSWFLAILSLATIATGYSLARGWIADVYMMSTFHRMLEIGFIAFLIVHIAITLVYYRHDWSKTFQGIRERKGTHIHALRLVQRISSWLIVVFALLVILTGLSGDQWFAQATQHTIPFQWHRVFDIFLIGLIVIHVAIGLKFAFIRRRIKGRIVNLFIIGLIISLLFASLYLEASSLGGNSGNQPGGGNGPPGGPTNHTVITPPQNGTIPIDRFLFTEFTIGSTVYNVNVYEIQTIRPDIFKPGTFSLFDLLVHLDNKGEIDLEYHFDDTMNTYVIDSMEEKEYWWYTAYYSGGWSEPSAFRMDHYPWKEGTTLFFQTTTEQYLNQLYAVYREEISKKLENNGNVIIPRVTIEGKTETWIFYNVNVTAHNLRNDSLQEGVITAIDVIMTLGDDNRITYELQWYESIGSADIVRDYWVEMINGDRAYYRCGWVYESGAMEYYGFSGNHIHIPSDMRVLNSPEYMLWFWICI